MKRKILEQIFQDHLAVKPPASPQCRKRPASCAVWPPPPPLEERTALPTQTGSDLISSKNGFFERGSEGKPVPGVPTFQAVEYAPGLHCWQGTRRLDRNSGTQRAGICFVHWKFLTRPTVDGQNPAPLGGLSPEFLSFLTGAGLCGQKRAQPKGRATSLGL